VNNASGIVSYGYNVPRYRIRAEEIARVWGADGKRISKGLNVIEKSVPGIDEDTATISVEAARMALKRRGIDGKRVGAIFVGSESHPYAVKPTGTIVGEAICASPEFYCADLEFACKAGTAAMQIVHSMVMSGMIEYGLAIGADTSQAAPGDTLEYTASAGGAAFIFGKEGVIANLNTTASFTTDTPDFWRREGAHYPSHGGRFTGEPAYFKHTQGAARMLMEKIGTTPSDYDYAVFHQPNGKFPLEVGRMLGFEKKQLDTGLLSPLIGNTYSGASPLGLCAILDEAKEGQRIFMTSYGSGAGSDAFDFTVTGEIGKVDRKKTLREMIADCERVDYAIYSKMREKLRRD